MQNKAILEVEERRGSRDRRMHDVCPDICQVPPGGEGLRATHQPPQRKIVSSQVTC